MLIEDQITYDPDTGLFKWLEPTYPKKPGWISGSQKGNGYLRIKVNQQQHAAHRLAWYLMHGKWPDNMIDHIDGNPLNNKLNNLRDVSSFVNQQNRKKAQRSSLTGLIGVTEKRPGRYYARITADGERKCLGTFDTPEQAHQAYLEAKRKYHKGNTL